MTNVGSVRFPGMNRTGAGIVSLLIAALFVPSGVADEDGLRLRRHAAVAQLALAGA